MRQRRWFYGSAVVGLLVIATVGAALGANMAPSATVTTLISGWEHWLGLEWTAQAQPNGQSIDGYVVNKYGAAIYQVRLLAQALDARGEVVSQNISWVQGTVPAMQRAYFKVPELPQADRYRVSVWAFEVVQSKSLP